ncbi:MAG: DNA-processing protein DprA [Caldilineaceae bacterium]
MNETAYWVGFNMVPGIGPARMASLLEAFGTAEAAWNGSRQTLVDAGLDRRSLDSLQRARREIDLDQEWRRIVSAGIRVLTWEHADYPANLQSLDTRPPLLYVRGELCDDDIWAVAIVGTRRASVYGREVAAQVTTELARAGVVIVSGLALGIDTVAHRTALDAGQRTIAVLGSGVDQIYPPENRGLAARIAENGAIVSEYPLGTRPEASNFPPRNRVISGLSKAVVIVEAPSRSGALITARFAAEQGREVFAVPGNIVNPGSAGCNELIQNGAAPLLKAQDVLDQLHFEHEVETYHQQKLIPTDPLEDQLLDHLSLEPTHVDDLVRSANLPPPQVASLLTMMELKGLVRQVGTLSYVRS